MALREDYRNASEEDYDLNGTIDQVFLESYPRIHEYLSTAMVDGLARLLSDLKISKTAAGYAATLSDPQFNRHLRVEADTFMGAIDLLEEEVTKKRPAWTIWTRPGQRTQIQRNRWSDDSPNGEAK